MDSFKDKMNSLESELRDKIDEIEKAFSENSDDEDSQMNESIENVSGEINDADSHRKSQRSNRLQPGKKPNVGTLEVNDADVMSVPQSGRNSNMDQSATVARRETDDIVYPLAKESGDLNPSPIKGVVTTTKVIGMGGSTRQIIAGNSQVTITSDHQSVKGDGAESSVHGKSQTKSQKSRFSLKSRKAGGMSKQ